MAKKIKAIVLNLFCPCGKKWTAAFPTGKLTKTAKCPHCLNFVLTSGNGRTPPDNLCAGCKRPLLNKHHCTYCGRPATERTSL